MPLALGLDLGTTSITALALDISNGEIVARNTVANDAEVTKPADKARGYSEWDAGQIISIALGCLRSLSASLGARLEEVAGLGLTGQQHGVVLVDERATPVSPFINWQDRRVEEVNPDTCGTWLAEIRSRVGKESRDRTGCTISPGYMAATLYWLKAQGLVPDQAKAYFLVDYVAMLLTGSGPVTDATSAASTGLLYVQQGEWDWPTIEALELPPDIFPEILPAGAVQGTFLEQASSLAGLPTGLPVCVGLGDNQASFFGSVADLEDAVLVNVGTGGQVAAYSEQSVSRPNLETRPFPGGYLVVKAGLCGGRTYALLGRFFRQVCSDLGCGPPAEVVLDTMNRLAADIAYGADGLRWEPLFTGTRENPELRGTLTGMSIENFTPSHFSRALLEGMAAVFHDGYLEIAAALGGPRKHLVGAGNGLRENAVLAGIVAAQFGMPMMVATHREEAAFGAALLAAVGLGLLPDRKASARLIHYEPSIGRGGHLRQSRIDQAADKLRERFGADALRRGSVLLHGAKHRPMPRPGSSDGHSEF